MRKFDDHGIGAGRGFEVEASVLVEEIAQEAVFGHGELVAGRQRDRVVVAIKEALSHEAMVSRAALMALWILETQQPGRWLGLRMQA
jgi:hypothetical protein